MHGCETWEYGGPTVYVRGRINRTAYARTWKGRHNPWLFGDH